MPEDQREIEAALRAGVISYRLFPYYAWRFGERGTKFTRSDSAWLAWLTGHSQQYVDEQIDWLRNVLSSRGMPSWLLEIHLRVLHRKLAQTIPNNQAKYDCLLKTAKRLRAAAEASISTQRTRQLVTDFARAFEPNRSSMLTGTGRLLVAAVVDERLGVKNAVSSLKTWLADVPQLRELVELRERLCAADCRRLDSDSFRQEWQHAIEEAIAEARRS